MMSAAVRLIGSLYIQSEAGSAAGQGWGGWPEGGQEGAWQHPGRAAGGNWGEPGEAGGGAGQGPEVGKGPSALVPTSAKALST